MSDEYTIKPEWAYMMNEDFIPPEKLWYKGDLIDVVSYGLFSEWAFSDYKQCMTYINGEDFCMAEKTDKFPDDTYAIFTKYIVFVPCVGCGSFTAFDFRKELQQVIK